MKILSEQEMAKALNFKRPIHQQPEPQESIWCIPFEYGVNSRGTKISIAKAREIAAELRAAVAEAEMRELRRALALETARARELTHGLAAKAHELFEANEQVALLERRLRSKAKSGKR